MPRFAKVACDFRLLLAFFGWAAAADGAAAAQALRAGQLFRDCPDCPQMVVAPAGSFVMGSPPREMAAMQAYGMKPDDDFIAAEFPQHRVTIRRAFAAGRYEVTVGQFAAFVKATGYQAPGGCDGLHADGEYAHGDAFSWRDPGYPQTDQHPVTCINFADAQAYVAWLRARTGKPYRLLSESEWEYAVRAGSTSRYWWGDKAEAGCGSANMADADGRKLYPGWGGVDCRDGHATASPAGSYAPNAFGLYDVVGNAWEWVQDCWNKDYVGAPADGRAWMAGDCQRHVRRSGAFDHTRWNSRVTARLGHPNAARKGNTGLRVAVDL